MKTLFVALALILIGINTAYAQTEKMTPEEMELERQRIQLQREEIELEKQKLELEKMRLNTSQNGVAPTPQRPPVKKETFSKDLYLGFDYVFTGIGTRTVTINDSDIPDEKFTVTGAGVKFGFGRPDENRVELFYYQDHISFEESQNDWDVTLYGIDYLFVWYEYFDKHISPYLKIGLVSAKSDDYVATLEEMGYTVDSGSSTISGGWLRMGMGVFFLIDEQFEATIGLDSSGIDWQKMTLSNATESHKVEIHDSIGTYFLNINYFF